VRYRTPPHCGFAIAEIYNWFTKGFELPDLKDAKALLDDLRTWRHSSSVTLGDRIKPLFAFLLNMD